MEHENSDDGVRHYALTVIYLSYWSVAILYAPSFGGDIGGLGAVPPAGPAPGQGVWERSPQKLKAFCFTIFSEARAEIKRFDRF